MSARKKSLIGAALAGLVFIASPAQAAQQQATVILSQRCEYLLLNSSRGMVLVKQLDGTTPLQGDTLQGSLDAGDFSDLHNTRNQASMQVWVDLVDPHNSKALSAYGRYCT